MAARGTVAKDAVFAKILETFEGSFMENPKTLRIPMQENGETIEVKVTLTAAKDVMGAAAASDTTSNTEPTAEEVAKTEALLNELSKTWQF